MANNNVKIGTEGTRDLRSQRSRPAQPLLFRVMFETSVRPAGSDAESTDK